MAAPCSGGGAKRSAVHTPGTSTSAEIRGIAGGASVPKRQRGPTPHDAEEDLELPPEHHVQQRQSLADALQELPERSRSGTRTSVQKSGPAAYSKREKKNP